MLTLILLACSGEPASPPAEPPAPEPVEAPAELPKPDLTPPPPATSPEGMHKRADAMRRLCERDCGRSLSFATDPGKPDESRAVMWWGISEAEVSDEIRAEIEAAAGEIAAAPAALWSPMAASLRHTEAGKATLSEVMKTGADPALRAAAACALLGGLPTEEWKDHDLDDDTISAMGPCTTPWRRDKHEDSAPG